MKLIICENNYKEKFLNVKFYAKREFFKKYFFDYINKTIYYLVKKYNLKIKIDNKDTLVIDTNYKSYFSKGTILKIYNVNNNKKDMKLYRVNDENVWELKKVNYI